MKTDEYIVKRRDLAKRFEDIFSRLLSNEKFDLYEAGLSSMFEVISTNLLSEIRQNSFLYFDGVVDLNVTKRKPRQIEFTGQMWIGEGRSQWKEDFRATVIDKRVTNQGICVALKIGDFEAVGELTTAFAI